MPRISNLEPRTGFNMEMVHTGPAGSRNAGTRSSPVTGGLEGFYLAIFLQNAPQSQKKSGNPVLHFAGKIEMAKSKIR